MKTQQEKDQAKAKAAATKQAMKAPDTVAAVLEFAPAWQALERDLRSLFREAGIITAEMIAALDLPYTIEGKERLSSMVRACTDAPDLRKAASMWCAAIMSEQDVAKITTWKELRAASIAGNEKLGVKRRGKSAEQVQASKAAKLGDDIWTHLTECLKTEAGRAKCREVLNAAGYEMTAVMKLDAEIPGTRKLRKAA